MLFPIFVFQAIIEHVGYNDYAAKCFFNHLISFEEDIECWGNNQYTNPYKGRKYIRLKPTAS